MSGFGNLEKVSKQVNEVVNYVNEYKKRNLKANGNDMLALYKIVSEYEKQIEDFARGAKKSGDNNQAQFIELAARREDARFNKRMIAGAIAKSMKDYPFDANACKNKLTKILSEKDQTNKAVKELFASLTEYNNVMSDSVDKSGDGAITKANTKVRLINACIGYIKNFNGNPAALDTVYDIAAHMGFQNIKAFERLSDKQLKLLPERKYMGYQKITDGKFAAHYMENSIADSSAPEEFRNLLSNVAGKSQQEKDAEYDKYLNYMYGKDRFARYDNKDKVLKELEELNPNATQEEKYTKLGEEIAEKKPWHNIKIDDSNTSKEKFTRRQEAMRQWFPDDTLLLYGATKDKNKARSFYNELNNETYNGFFRSLKNSPEYTALLNALNKFANTPEANPIKDEANLKAVKDACSAYLQHYVDKPDSRKSEFAKMRRDKVEELLTELGGNVKEITKTSKLGDQPQVKTNIEAQGNVLGL